MALHLDEISKLHIICVTIHQLHQEIGHFSIYKDPVMGLLGYESSKVHKQASPHLVHVIGTCMGCYPTMVNDIGGVCIGVCDENPFSSA